MSRQITISLCVCDIDIELDDSLMEEWFSLVHEKNKLVKQESDYVYM